MVRTVTVTETVTRLAIDAGPTSPPPPPPLYHDDGLGPTLAHVALPAFLSTAKFLLTLAAVFLATACVSFLVLGTRAQIRRLSSGGRRGAPPPLDPDPDAAKATALAAARCVALSHALTVLILVLRTRQALGSLAPVAYEIFTLVLGVEAAVVLVVGAAFGVAKGMEMWEEERGKREKGE